jgi:glycogen debranching enzyme
MRFMVGAKNLIIADESSTSLASSKETRPWRNTNLILRQLRKYTLCPARDTAQLRCASPQTCMQFAAFMLLVLFTPHATASAQQTWLRPVPNHKLVDSAITLRRPVETEKPFTVAGECGAILGQQNGSFESWIFPVKLFSHLVIEAHVDGYDVPIDVNRAAAEIEVAPDHTVITYSHIAFTLKETFFATQCSQQDGTGVVALFQLSSIRPMTLTLSFTPEMKRMWPAPISGDVDPEWVRVGDSASVMNDTTRPGGSGARYGAGWYMIHTDFADLAGAIALPSSEPGIMPPYQEKTQSYPLQFVLRFDPAHDTGRSFPLLMAVGTTKETATRSALEARLAALNTNIVALYQQNANYYAHFFDTRLTVESPDAAFDRDLRWASIAIDQVRVRHSAEVGLVAGFFSSGSSARPGFGWFFGRDTLFTTWGINSYGDYALTRDALAFLIRRQREDGKMPHEFSQTAELVDWEHLPYEYAAADATPLFLMAMDDYVTMSGDVGFLRSNWEAVARAWNFETTHDSDGDGIYDNAQGTGWVESWPQGMPHQEIYLAALDQQASTGMAHLAALTGHNEAAQTAQQRASAIEKTILAEYSQPNGMYAFSRNPDGTADLTASIFPAIAWWGHGLALPDAARMFERWASHEFSTDWGTRDIGEREVVYDPISYHQGSVWPLFTGWSSLAEYRTGRDLAGYSHLMENANLTTAQDLGAVTELLSGAYYVPFGRSTSHQMWSSAMVLVPAVRGLFGVQVDALRDVVTVDPHLPAQWPRATLHNVQVGTEAADIAFVRDGNAMLVTLTPMHSGSTIKLASAVPGAKMSGNNAGDGSRELRVPLPPIEVGLFATADSALPSPGSTTAGMKILREDRQPRQLTLVAEAPGGTTQEMFFRSNDAGLHVEVKGATLRGTRLEVVIPAGAGVRQQTVTLSW